MSKENPELRVDDAKIEEMKKALLAPAKVPAKVSAKGANATPDPKILEVLSADDPAVDTLLTDYLANDTVLAEDPVSEAPATDVSSDTTVFRNGAETNGPEAAGKQISAKKMRSSRRPVPANKNQRTAAQRTALAVVLILTIGAAAFGAWAYWWITHGVFEYNLRPVVVLDGQVVMPDAFLRDTDGGAPYFATFQQRDFELVAGHQVVPLTLRMGWRTVNTNGDLFVLIPLEHIRREYATEGAPLQPLDMLANAELASNVDFDVHFVDEPLPLIQYPIGEFVLNLVLNDAPFEVVLIIEDSTPPMAEAINLTIPMSESVSPDSFVTEIYDASQIASISFVSEPDVFVSGEQTVEVAITDIYGNMRVIPAVLTVLRNEIPPTFEGIPSLLLGMVGEPVPLHEGIIALDAFGRELEFEVNTINVDFNSVGTYTVIYWVQDNCGNQTQEEVTLELHNVDPNYVIERVDAVLAEILTGDMTQVEMVRAIHGWVRNNVTFAGAEPEHEPETSLEGAYFALQNGRGNNIIFFSISEVLLTRADIPNMRIQRAVAGNNQDDDGRAAPSPFTWNLINPDNRGWHHFDSMPTRLRAGSLMYMFTASQAERIDRDFVWYGNPPGRYNFDPDGDYPDIVP